MSTKPRASSGPRIVIASPNASPYFGGEAMLPLQYFLRLNDRGGYAILVTHERNRSAMTALRPDLETRMFFTPDTWLHKLLWRAGRRLPGFITEVFFGVLLNLYDGILQHRIIRSLVRTEGVDLIHVPTPVSPASPSVLGGFGIPVVFGPMNGGMHYPPGYDDIESKFDRGLLWVGRTLAWLANLMLPAKRSAALLLVANKRTLAALPLRTNKVLEICENGVDYDLWSGALVPKNEANAGPLRIVFLGRLVDWKAVDVALGALKSVLAAAPDAATLTIVGDGPERSKLESLAVERGIDAKVTFRGFLTQDEAAGVMAKSDVLILPSLRECGGAVVLEAMASGLAVIASDWGGPADYIDETCGILVSPVPRETFASRLAEAISTLANDRSLVVSLGQNGRKKAKREFDWDSKIEEMEKIYRSLTNS